MKIYLAGPIGDLTFEEASFWRKSAAMLLRPLETVSPLRGMTEVGQDPPRSMFMRDHHDVMTCDAMLVNFIGAAKISKGTLIEIGWAYAYRKPVVMAIEGPENPNWSGFVTECVPFIEPTLDEAINTMRTLLNSEEAYQSSRTRRALLA